MSFGGWQTAFCALLAPSEAQGGLKTHMRAETMKQSSVIHIGAVLLIEGIFQKTSSHSDTDTDGVTVDHSSLVSFKRNIMIDG